MPQFPQEWLVAQTGKINLAERWVMIPLVPFTPETDEWQEQLEQANAVDQLVRPLMLQMVGPAAGGVIVATAGTGTPFLVDADTFGVSTCALLLLRRYPVERDRSAETSVVEEIREGFRFVRSGCETWSEMAVWRNWVGNQACEPRGMAVPRDEAEVRSLVARAARAGLAVRVAGAGHSFTPVVLTDGLLLDLHELRGVHVEVETRRVTVRGGTRIEELGDPLWEAGLSLVNMGDIDEQALGGAVATGTHGTGVTLPSFSASLRHARLVTASGDVVELSPESDPDLFRAAQVSIGMLGVMTQVTLEVTEAYVLHERLSYVELDELLERYDDLLHGHRHFSFFYFPSERSAALYGEATTAPAPGTAKRDDVCSVKVMDALDAGTPPGTPGLGERIDRLDRICPSEFDPNFHELEYMLPLEHGKVAFLELRELLRTGHPEAIYPVECRFTAGDDAYLSPNRGGPTAVISVSGGPGTDYWPFLRDCDAIFREHGGRPHWGKLHFMTPDRLDELFPEIERFRELRRELDPSGVFLNPHLRELFA